MQVLFSIHLKDLIHALYLSREMIMIVYQVYNNSPSVYTDRSLRSHLAFSYVDRSRRLKIRGYCLASNLLDIVSYLLSP